MLADANESVIETCTFRALVRSPDHISVATKHFGPGADAGAKNAAQAFVSVVSWHQYFFSIYFKNLSAPP